MTLKKLVRRTVLIGAIGLIAGAACTRYAGEQRAKTAEEVSPPIGSFVTVGDRRVHYVQQGSGPHVVLLHGAGGNLREFTFGVIDALAEDFTVTAFDRPGLGYTDRVPGVDDGWFATEGDSPGDQATMLRAAAAQIGVTDPVVVGHSFGGIVAAAWAVQGLDSDSPQNASAYVSLAGVMMPWPGPLGSYYTTNGSALGGAFISPIYSALATDARIAQAVAGIFAPQSPPADYLTKGGAVLAIRPETFRANVRQVNTLRPHVVEMVKRYPELTLPIEVLHGTADTTVPMSVHPQEFVKLVPSMNLTVLDGVGHMPHHVDPDATVATIRRAYARTQLR